MSTETTRSPLLTSAPNAALMFPTLTFAQIARIKRVASAVGEGSIAVSFVNRVPAESA